MSVPPTQSDSALHVIALWHPDAKISNVEIWEGFASTARTSLRLQNRDIRCTVKCELGNRSVSYWEGKTSLLLIKLTVTPAASLKHYLPHFRRTIGPWHLTFEPPASVSLKTLDVHAHICWGYQILVDHGAVTSIEFKKIADALTNIPGSSLGVLARVAADSHVKEFTESQPSYHKFYLHQGMAEPESYQKKLVHALGLPAKLKGCLSSAASYTVVFGEYNDPSKHLIHLNIKRI